MTAPSRRLVLLFLAVAFPASVVAGTVPGAMPVGLAAVGGLLLLALADLALSVGRLDPVEIHLPDLARLTKDDADMIKVRANRTSGTVRTVLFGIALPPSFDLPSETIRLGLPNVGEDAWFDYPIRPTRRGEVHLTECWIEGLSPLGCWRLRARRTCDCRIRVYPNLFSERRALSSLFLNRGALGLHARRQIGKGHEFEKLREYVAGDSTEDIHWKATARRARPITKVFQVERTQEVYVILDSSRLSGREVPDTPSPRPGAPAAPPVLVPLLERYIRVALILGMVAERQGDRHGLVTFSDRVDNFIRAGSGRAHYGVCRDAVYTLEPRRVAPDYDELFRFIRARLHRRSLLVFLTHLDDPALAESFSAGLDLIARKHLVLVNMVAPRDAAPLFSGEPPATDEDVYRRLAGHLSWEGIRQLDASLHVRGVRLRTLSHERMAPEIVGQYLEIKQRQML